MTKKVTLKDFQIELQKKTIPSGVKFVHYKKENAPIALTIASRSGSRYDPVGKEGLAHFLEHMLFEGTEKYKNKKELSLVLEEIGGLYGASTSTESIKIEFTVAKKEHLSVVAEVVDQILNKSLFLDKKIDSERKVIKTEISSKLDTHKRIIYNNIKDLIFADSPITHNISGSDESVDNINRDDLVNYHANIFPQELILVSCGGCDIEDLITTFTQILPYKPLEGSGDVFLASKALDHYGVTKMPDFKLLYGQLAFLTCPFVSPDRVPFSVLSNYLGKGRTSLFKEILRYDNGLLYAVNTGNHHYADTGYFYIDFSLKAENLELTLTKIHEALENLLMEGIPESALTIIKNKVLNSSAISMQTVRSWVDFQYYKELVQRENNYNYDDFLNTIANITKKEIDAVAQKYLSKENMYLWLVGDFNGDTISRFFQ